MYKPYKHYEDHEHCKPYKHYLKQKTVDEILKECPGDTSAEKFQFLKEAISKMPLNRWMVREKARLVYQGLLESESPDYMAACKALIKAVPSLVDLACPRVACPADSLAREKKKKWRVLHTTLECVIRILVSCAAAL